MQVSKNFTLEELCASATAKAKHIDNTAPTQVVINLTHLVANVLQPLRDAVGVPVKVGSGYRSPRLNAAVGGADNSQHMMGQAVDICIDGDINKGQRWFGWIKDHCQYDQLIWEKNPKTGSYWIHVSYRFDGQNRRQVIPLLLKK